MNWIDTEVCKPPSYWHVCLVTDGTLVCLAHWVDDPKQYYGEELEDENGDKLDEEWHDPHWVFITEIGPFYGSDECFGIMDFITHWMPIPAPPNMIN